MSNQIAITEVATGFRFLLTETFESVHGAYLDKNTSLFETLADISAAAASQPMGNCATIAAHIAHTTYYLRVLEDRMFGRDLSYVNWEQIWDDCQRGRRRRNGQASSPTCAPPINPSCPTSTAPASGKAAMSCPACSASSPTAPITWGKSAK